MTVEVGVREFRAKLRAYLDRVQSGDEVIVTDRGRRVARIVAPESQTTLERLIAEGRVTPAKEAKRFLPTDDLPRLRGEGPTLSEIVVGQRRGRY